MEPFTTATIAIGSALTIQTMDEMKKSVGKKISDTLLQKIGDFLNALRKESPETVTAIEKAPEQALDYGQAVLETEAAAKANPEVAQRIQELVAMVSCRTFKLHSNFPKSSVTRGLSPLPLCVLDIEQLRTGAFTQLRGYSQSNCKCPQLSAF